MLSAVRQRTAQRQQRRSAQRTVQAQMPLQHRRPSQPPVGKNTQRPHTNEATPPPTKSPTSTSASCAGCISPAKNSSTWKNPLSELRKRLRDYDYASEGYLYNNIPTASAIEQARADHGDDFSIDWWGLQFAATEAVSSRDGCYGYFPQLFSGLWTPRAQPPDETPTPSPDQQRGIDALHAIIQRVLNSSLYLPRP